MQRNLYLILGFIFLGLAFLGALLPLLPATPFALLASAMFMRSSPRMNRWMLRTRLIGPVLRDWQRHRGVRPRVKVVAVATLLAVGGGSLALLEMSPLMQWIFVGLLLIGLLVVLSLPLVREPEASSDTETNSVS